MLHITYQNNNGTLEFRGGKGRNSWRIIEIDGLGLATKSFNTAEYPGSVGQRTLSETLSARTISIQCDVSSIKSCYGGTQNNRWEISKALKILNEPGTMLISDGCRTRKITARCVEAVQGERHGGYVIFAMQFVCDYPYFEDKKTKTIPLFKVEKLLGGTTRWYTEKKEEYEDEKDRKLLSESIESGKFKLPCMFTRRTSNANVINLGDVDTEPIIRVSLGGNADDGTNGAFGTLVINNESTKQSIELNLQNTEKITTVTLDIPNRKIYSQDNQNLIHYLSPSSFLSDFWLKKGQNQISVLNNMSEFCTVVCEFSNKYVEAVIG